MANYLPHTGVERERMLEALGLEAPLRLRLRLGEGSGCPLLFSLLDAACAVYHKMATFEEARIDPGYLEKLKR